MVGEAVEKKLYNAASKGDVKTFQQLLEEDPYLVDVVTFAYSRNVVHVATLHGQTSIVEEVLKISPRLARISDSHKLSPLHIAAAEGQVKITSILLSMAPEMCWWRDDQGMNPVHIAAMNGHVEVLELLLQESPLPAAERLHRGQTVMHLCVKHCQLVALKVLVEKLGELVCAKDDDGETVLHLAVRCNQLETIRYLVESKTVEKQTRNSMGKTALQILNESSTSYSEIRGILTSLSNESFFEVLPKMTDVTMVVGILIATMAFQSAISPPGGVWQDSTSSHTAGEAVLASTNPKIYGHLLRANTTAFTSSLITIFLVTTGLPSMNFFFMAGAVYAMWVSMTAIAISFGVSVMVISPDTKTQSLGNTIMTMVAVSLNLFGWITAYFAIRHLYLSWKNKKRQQQHLTNQPLIRRAFYWIFQQLETRGYLRADR